MNVFHEQCLIFLLSIYQVLFNALKNVAFHEVAR